MYKTLLIKMSIFFILFNLTFAQKLFREHSSATSYITFSNRCFSINGKPTWIFAGQLEYWRIPKELWRDRLMRVKRAGYNTISFYVPWNLHEPVRGEFHFEDNLDIDGWLTLIKEMGLYAFVRVGPYICAEVDFGGFPPWLVDIPNIKLRSTNSQYLQCVDAFYEKIFPIVTKHQITKGGAVILIQLENEHYPPGGSYQTHLVDKAKSLGMVVPYVWSDIYNATEFEPGAFPELTSKGFMTEQWVGWIGRYGDPGANDANTYIRQTWKMVACGSGGTSHYMAHGGTNFGYTASPDQRITSYDYGTHIGELGQLRNVYWSVKQVGWLVNTFSPLVANSTNGSSEINTLPSGLTYYVHSGSTGKAAFVLNTGSSTASFQINWKNKGVTVPTSGNWSLEGSRCAYFLADVPITDNVTLDYSATGILCKRKYGLKNYLVLYSTSGNSGGDIAFVYKTAPSSPPSSPWNWNSSAKRASLRFTYPTTDTAYEVILDDGIGQTINLLIMNNSMSNRTWITDSLIICGPAYVDENEILHFPASGGKAYIFSKDNMQVVTKDASNEQSNKPLSSGWSWITLPEVGTNYDDSNWKESQTPQTMTSYGWPNGYGWYRTTYNAQSAGTVTLTISNKSGDVFIFVNGAYAGTSTNQSISLKEGKNTIAILAVAAQRDKMYNTFDYEPPDKCRSGIWGKVTIGGNVVGLWRFRGGFEGIKESPMMGNISSESWNTLLSKNWSTGTPPSDRIPRLWRIDFTYTPPQEGLQTWTLKATVTNGTQGIVWLNGKCLGRQLINQPPLFVPQCWLKEKNTFIVLTHDGSSPQGYSLQPVEYRSFLRTNITVTNRVNMESTKITKFSANIRLLNTGNNFVCSSRMPLKNNLINLYNLQGSVVKKRLRTDGNIKFTLQKVKNLSNGIFIAVAEK